MAVDDCADWCLTCRIWQPSLTPHNLHFWCALCHQWFKTRIAADEHDCRDVIQASRTHLAETIRG